MKRQAILNALGAHREELLAMGVKSLALFGSAARDDAKDGSDIDLLVEFDGPVSLFDYARVQRTLVSMLGGEKVDLVMRRAVLDELREDICSGAVDAI